MGCHIIDYPIWALKLTYPTTVEAYSSPVYEESPPQSSLITYTFNSGLDGSPVKIVWYDGGLKPNMPEGLGHEDNLWNSISFQDHGGKVWYRNIRIKEL